MCFECLEELLLRFILLKDLLRKVFDDSLIAQE